LNQKAAPIAVFGDFLNCVTRPGFEPRQAESESAVLPLYYRALQSTFLVTLLVQNSNFLMKDLQLLADILAA
jgi:hypothetical protein